MGKVLDIIAHIVLPNKCMFCGRAVVYDRLLCDDCDHAKPLMPRLPLPEDSGLDGLAVPFWYEMGVERAIQDMKFSGNLLNARKLAFYMAQRVWEEEWFSRVDLLMPIPMWKPDQRERGYNQSEQLGKWCARKLGLPLCTDGLQKIRRTRPQHELSALERRQNLRGAYRADPVRVRGRNILLIDDVFTTGSTLSECADTLQRAGAASVYALTAAKTRAKTVLCEPEADERPDGTPAECRRRNS